MQRGLEVRPEAEPATEGVDAASILNGNGGKPLRVEHIRKPQLMDATVKKLPTRPQAEFGRGPAIIRPSR